MVLARRKRPKFKINLFLKRLCKRGAQPNPRRKEQNPLYQDIISHPTCIPASETFWFSIAKVCRSTLSSYRHIVCRFSLPPCCFDTTSVCRIQGCSDSSCF